MSTRQTVSRAFQATALGLLVSQWVWIALGLTLTATLAVLSWRLDRADWERQFKDEVEALVADLERAEESAAAVLRSAAAFAESSERVTREEFLHFAKTLSRSYPYMTDMRLVVRVRRAEVQRLEDIVRKQFDSRFAVKSQGDTDEAAVVLFAESDALVGLDLSLLRRRYDALSVSLRTGRVVSSEKIDLLGDQADKLGYLLAVPFTAPSGLPGLTAWHGEPNGWVAAALRPGSMIAATLGDYGRRGFALELFDGTEPDPARLIYGSPHPGTALRRQVAMTILDQQVLTVWTAGPTFHGGMKQSPALLIGFGGTVLTMLVALLLQLVRNRAADVEVLAAERTSQLADATAELRAAHGELQLLNQQLEQRVAERTGDLRRLAAIFSHAADAIILEDLHRTVTDLNPAAERVFGWPKAELVGQSAEMMIAPEDREAATDGVRHVLAGGEIRDVEERRLTRQGEVRHLLRSQTLLRDEDGRPQGILSLFKDITDLKLAQQRLEASLAQLGLIAAVGRVIFGAKTRAELYETVAEALAGRSGYDAVLIWHVNQQAKVLELAAASGGISASPLPTGTRIPVGEGRPGWAAAHGTVVTDQQTNMGSGGWVTPETRAELDVPVLTGGQVRAVITAISRRPDAFDDEHRSALEAIAERTAAGLERVNLYEELNAKSDEMETFLHATSHDLRSPLVNIQGFSQELQLAGAAIQEWVDQLPVPDTEKSRFFEIWTQEVETSLRFIGASVRKMEALVNGLLQLSRIGRQPLVYTAVNVEELVQDVLDSMQGEFTSVDVTVEVESLPQVEADRTRLSQVFSNLIGNAVKYRDPSRQATIWLYGEVRDGWCRYCVEDNGIGVAPEYQEQIFLPFHRLTPREQSDPDSYGLGLSIVDRIVRRHRGRVWVESEPGKGSRFWFELPEKREPLS
jgi:PAS domain S-box-containing protein